MYRTGSGHNASRARTFPRPNASPPNARRTPAERLRNTPDPPPPDRPPAERLAVDGYPRPVLGSVTPSPEPAPSLPGAVTAVTASPTPSPSGSIAPSSGGTQEVTHWFDVFLG